MDSGVIPNKQSAAIIFEATEGNISEAIICYEKALTIYQFKQLPLNRFTTARNLGNLGYENKGRFI